MSKRLSIALGVWLPCLAALGCATAPPVGAPGLALKKVVIYRNGVGYFERGGHVDSDRVMFKVRKDEVGDFLATLAVLERTELPPRPRSARRCSRSRRRSRGGGWGTARAGSR